MYIYITIAWPPLVCVAFRLASILERSVDRKRKYTYILIHIHMYKQKNIYIYVTIA